MLDRKVPQEAAAIFPEFEVGYLDQVLHQGSRRLAPQGGRAHDGETDGPSDPGNELLPRLVIARSGTETDDIFQGQRRISCRSGSVQHFLFLLRVGRRSKSAIVRVTKTRCDSSTNLKFEHVSPRTEDWMIVNPSVCKNFVISRSTVGRSDFCRTPLSCARSLLDCRRTVGLRASWAVPLKIVLSGSLRISRQIPKKLQS